MSFKNIFQDTSNLRGGTFFDKVELGDDYVIIYYYASYDSYRKGKPDSQLEYSQFINYWSTGKSVEKMIAEPVRLMKNYTDLKCVTIIFGDDKVKYKIKITKDDFENHTGLDIYELKDEQKWIDFVDKYIYSINNLLRTSFYNKFVKISKL